MVLDFSFRDVDGTRTISQAVNFLSEQSLGYPRYGNWVEKTEAELMSGFKGGIVAYNDGRIAGDIVCQLYKRLYGVFWS